MPNARNIILGLLVCIAAGSLCAWLHTPLPWMIGSLLGMAICNFSGARLAAPPAGREAGQIIIAMALGLYFTPPVAREVLQNAPLLAGAAFGAIGIGYVASRALSRFARVDAATAFFSSIPGGATEMAILGERFGAQADKVAVVHSLRILIVVCTIPVLLTLIDIHGGDVYRPVRIPFAWGGIFILLGVALISGWLVAKLRFPNAWLIGPLIATIALTASGVELSSLPTYLTNAGQVLLGCALGSRFSREFLMGAPRFVGVVLITIVLMILLSIGLAWCLAKAANIFVPSMILACAPGGIAEMSITARTLQLSVALVTAAHVTRMLIIVTLTLPIYQLLFRQKTRHRK